MTIPEADLRLKHGLHALRLHVPSSVANDLQERVEEAIRLRDELIRDLAETAEHEARRTTDSWYPDESFDLVVPGMDEPVARVPVEGDDE